MITIFLSFILLINSSVQNEKDRINPLSLAETVSLTGIKGRIDHLAYNNKEGLIYVAALGNNTMEVVDLKNKKVIKSIKGLSEPQGIRYIPETNMIIVANGGSGELKIFDASGYKELRSIKTGDDADNVRYVPSIKTAYVGYGEGAIAAFDVTSLKQTADIKLEGHPESFQPDGSDRIYVNVPDAHLLEVVDLKQNKVTDKWEIKEASSNFPMALDKANNRLFIGCRHPAKLLVLDTKTGKIITSFDTDGDTDDLYFDEAGKYIYMSCGAGYVDVFRQIAPDRYEAVTKIETNSGARTSLFIPELNKLVVAAPARQGREAMLMIYGKQ